MKVRHNPAKWAQRAAAAGNDYAQGVQDPRVNWSEAALAAEETYAAAIQEAIGEGRYGKGIQKAGEAKWKKGVQEKGRARYQQGVSIAQDEYDRGFRPFVSTLEGTTLPPRGPKGQNYQRVQIVGEALRQAKKSL